MKVGSAVVGAHIAVLFAFSLTQGCLTTGTQNEAPGARHKGPFQHVRKSTTPDVMSSSVAPMPVDMGDNMDTGNIYQPIDMQVTPIEPMPTANVSATETYIVRKGDTISQLAVDFDTTTAELVRMNHLANPDVLYVGQELVVPAGRGGSRSTSSKSSSAPVKKGGTYTIQKGDTLSEIAIAAGVSIDSLRELNGIKGDMIRAGETLDIPAGGKVPQIKKSAPSKPAVKTTPKTEKAPETKQPEAPSLALPDLDSAPAAAAPEGTAPASFDVIEERVMYPGESLDDIAREYGVSKAEILRLNPQITDESQIPDGTRLRIPISE